MRRALDWLTDFIAVITKARRHPKPERIQVIRPYAICSADLGANRITDEMVSELYSVSSPVARQLWEALLAAKTDFGRGIVLAKCVKELKRHAGPGITFGYIKESNCYGYFRSCSPRGGRGLKQNGGTP